MKESLVSESRKKLVTDSITHAMELAGITEIIFAYKLNVIPEDTIVVSHLGKESEIFTEMAGKLKKDLFNYRPAKPVMTIINGKLREDIVVKLSKNTVQEILTRCTTYAPGFVKQMTNTELNAAWYDRWSNG